jgi:phosphoglycerate dehydrogenase-like enzyme
MDVKNILINEPDSFPLDAQKLLSGIGNVYFAGGDYPRELINIVFIRLASFIDVDFHKIHPSLQIIVTPTTGENHIDVDYFTSVGVKILSLKGEYGFLKNIHATSEHCVLLTLALMRKLLSAVHDVHKGNWNRYPFKGRELYGKVVFLMGYGRVGEQVAKLFNACGCKIYAYDIRSEKVPAEMFIDPFNGFQVADIVSLHVNLEQNTIGLVDKNLLKLMKHDSVFINTSRGEIVDQFYLLQLIIDGKIAGAALDVIQNEKVNQNHDFIQIVKSLQDKLIITPHIGGFTYESLEQVEMFVAKRLIEMLEKSK